MVRRLSAFLVAGAIALSLTPLTAGAQELPPIPSVPDTDSDTGGHETENPSGPDHASASAWEMTSTNDTGGQDEFVTIGKTHAEMDEDGANRSRATGLSIMGTEVVGASSQARNGTGHGQSDVPSGGCLPGDLICFAAAYAETNNSDGPDSSTAQAEGGVFALCLGPLGILEIECLVEAYALYSESQVTQDKRTGRTTSTAVSYPAYFCLPLFILVTENEPCIGAVSRSSSNTNGTNDGTTTRGSEYFYSFGPEQESFSENETFWGDLSTMDAGDGECPDGIGFGYCAHFNQGESFTFPGGAASRQEAMHAVGFSEGEVFGNFHFGTTETLARDILDEVLPEVFRRQAVATLAFTGGAVQSLAAIALAFLLIGGLVLAGSRRETV